MSEQEMKLGAELIFIPCPGAGHFKSAVELAYLLTRRDQRLSISVLVINLPFDTSNKTYINSLPEDVTSQIQFIELPPIVLSSKPVSESPLSFFMGLINGQIDLVRAAVTGLMSRVKSGRLVRFVIDILCASMIDVANEFGVPTYIFFTSGAAFLGFKFCIQTLMDNYDLDISKYKDGSEAELSVPGFINSVPAKVCREDENIGKA